MAWLNVHFFASSLGQTSAFDVILPEPDAGIGVTENVWNGVDPLPVLYLLSGHSDDHTTWMRRTSIERHCAGRRLAVVMPAGNRTFYSDQKHGYAYFQFLTEELPKVCKRFFRISDRPCDSHIAGLSMGGYGAMKAALTYPNRYASVASLSGGLDLLNLPPFLAFDDAIALDERRMAELKREDPARYYILVDLTNTFGSRREFEGSGDDLCALLQRRLESGNALPKMHISMGNRDDLISSNRRFLDLLDRYRHPYLFATPDGAHEWKVWDEMIPQILDLIAPVND